MAGEDACELFIQQHLKRRKGEAKRRLKDGHGHAEQMFLRQIWWSAFGNFEYLHPEYEIQDYLDGYRYLDFAYIRTSFRACFEIDGFGPHWRDVNRRQFADQLIRQNHLVLDDWKVFRFSYDDIRERPRQCQQLLQQMMGRWLDPNINVLQLSINEKEIVRLAKRIMRPVTPVDVSTHLDICRRTAQKHLQQLLIKQVFTAEGGGSIRIRSYRLQLNRPDLYM
jgi:hypothetical protein